MYFEESTSTEATPINQFGLLCFFRFHVVTWSHGQSQVQIFFSTNADMLLENLHNDSFIAKRIVYNHMKSKDPQPSKLRKRYSMRQITQNIRCSSVTAQSKYKAALENQKKKMVRRISKPKVSQKFIRNSAVPHFMNLSKEC